MATDSQARPGCIFFPCSGNGNGTSWNNRGSNGNYWSRSLNSQTNGRNLNFNSGGVNPQNNNNRFYGFSRRAVQHSSLMASAYGMMKATLLVPRMIMADTPILQGYKLTKAQLLHDLYVAYYDAARHKHKMSYVQKFEANLAENLNDLCDDLLTRRYEAQPSKCFRRQIPKEARGVRCHVPRPHRSSSLFQLYAPAL